MQFPEWEPKKNLKKLLVFKIITFEPQSTNSHNLEQDTSHWQSTRYQATLRFKISLRGQYSKAGFLRVMKKKMKVL